MAGLGTQDFSEQQIVDCTYQRYQLGGQLVNYGCGGGSPKFVIQYFNETNVVQEAQYPYRATRGSCVSPNTAKPRNVTYSYVQPISEDHLAYILSKNGPIVVFVYASSATFTSYAGGVFNDAAGCNQSVNQALLLVGVVKVNNQEQWIAKNSWGTRWGEQGFIRFPKGVNMCNIASGPTAVVSLGPIISI